MIRKPALQDIIIIALLCAVVGLTAYTLQQEQRILAQLETSHAKSSHHNHRDGTLRTPPIVNGTPPEKATEPIETAERVNPHADDIKRIESDAGVFLSRVAKLILHDEGNRSRPYLDSGGTVTIGVGRSLQTNGISVAELHAIVDEIDYSVLLQNTDVQNGRVRIGSLALANKIFVKPLTQHDIQLLLTDDLKNVAHEAEGVFGETWQKLDMARKEVVVDILFNLGLPHFKQFENFIGAVKQGNWDTAASELLLSNAARKNIVRYHRNAVVMQTGDAQYFGL